MSGSDVHGDYASPTDANLYLSEIMLAKSPETPKKKRKCKVTMRTTTSPFFRRAQEPEIEVTSPISGSTKDFTLQKLDNGPSDHFLSSNNGLTVSNSMVSEATCSDSETEETEWVKAELLLLKDPLYTFYLRKFARLYLPLLEAKPKLIQGKESGYIYIND